MSAGRRALSLRVGLALLAFSALFFFKPLEDAYTLPQGFGLGLAALALLLGLSDAGLPWTAVFWAGLGLHVWRLICHFSSPDLPAHGPWLAVEVPQLALFLGAAAALRFSGAKRFLACALLAAGALGAVYALLAPLDLDPFSSGAVDLGFGRRAHGTLGNPDFLGGWLAMLLPLGVACLARATGRARRAAILSVTLMSLALFLTLARGAWIAAGAGCAVAAALARPRPPWRASLLWGSGLLAACFLLLALGPGLRAVSGRLGEAVSPGSDAWTSRAFMAGVALDLALEHPYVGVGGGAFEMEYLRRQGRRLWAETGQPFRLTADAHNDWLQTAAETGFPGFLLWILLFALALRAAWAAGGPEGAAVAGALVAFGVQGCFHFPWDILPTAGLATAALSAAAGFGKAEAWAGPPAWPWVAALAVAACLAFDLRAVASSGLLNSGSALDGRSGAGQDRRLSQDLLAAGARLRPDDERLWRRLGEAHMGLGDPAGAVGAFQNAIQALPSDPDDWTDLGLCLGQTGRLQGAEAALRQAVLLNPRSNEAWSDAVKVESLLGRDDEALKTARQGIAEAGGSAQAWFNLGALLYNAGLRGQAAQAFEASLRFDPNDIQARSLLHACARPR